MYRFVTVFSNFLSTNSRFHVIIDHNFSMYYTVVNFHTDSLFM